MARTRITIPAQARVNEDFDVTNHKIVNLADPVDDLDAVNYRTFKALETEVQSTAGQIGEAEDEDYTDGLFTDFVPETPTGTAIDRFNEVLKGLSPSPAPDLDDISFDQTGEVGNLSFGTSNTISGYTNAPGDINSTFSTSGNDQGIFSAGTTVTGVLADNVAGEPDGSPYLPDSFGEANKGTLKLIVNGATEHEVDLSSFGSGSTTNSNGSGFTLSEAYPAKFESGQTLDVFMHRTGTWEVSSTDQVNGYNTVQVIHTVDGNDKTTDEYAWVNDDATDETTFTSENLGGLSMSGSKQLSGVTYHESGTAQYGLTISNAYRNTYSNSSSAISHNGTNCSASSQALPDMTTEADDVELTNKEVTISTGGRLLNESISLSTTVQRTIQDTKTSSGSSISGILMDPTSSTSNDTSEDFNDEDYRLHADLDETDIDVTNYSWDSSQSLMGSDNAHNTGLLISNGRLTYPSNTSHISGITDGNFTTPSNGPSGNVDYSTASGTRSYIRYFHDSNSRSNFNLNVQGTSINFIQASSGATGNNLTCEILAPNTTVDSGGTVEWKDATIAHDGNDANIGVFAGSYGDNIPTDWGITLGAKNTSTSGGYIVVRITAAADWTGSIDSIDLTWL